MEQIYFMERKEQIRRLVPTLVPWFNSCGRSLPWREDPTPYHVWVSEIMLQQTRIETVKAYYTRFLSEIPDIETLAAADMEHLQKLWEGLGYYTRVRNLQKAARQICEEYGGRFPEQYEEIRRLSGIGDYTAGAIASICFAKQVPAVDGNVLRVVARITADNRNIMEEKTRVSVRKELAEIYPAESPGTFTQALMELGETICLPNGTPFCEQCPCCTFCASSAGRWSEYPVKANKKARKKQQLTVFLLHCNGKVAVVKRQQKGLLAGMWELPNVQGHLDETQVSARCNDWNCEPVSCTRGENHTHIFTHLEWNMKSWSVECRRMPDAFQWVSEEQLQNEIALPTAFRRLVR